MLKIMAKKRETLSLLEVYPRILLDINLALYYVAPTVFGYRISDLNKVLHKIYGEKKKKPIFKKVRLSGRITVAHTIGVKVSDITMTYPVYESSFIESMLYALYTNNSFEKNMMLFMEVRNDFVPYIAGKLWDKILKHVNYLGQIITPPRVLWQTLVKNTMNFRELDEFIQYLSGFSASKKQGLFSIKKKEEKKDTVKPKITSPSRLIIMDGRVVSSVPKRSGAWEQCFWFYMDYYQEKNMTRFILVINLDRLGVI